MHYTDIIDAPIADNRCVPHHIVFQPLEVMSIIHVLRAVVAFAYIAGRSWLIPSARRPLSVTAWLVTISSCASYQLQLGHAA